MLRLSPRKPQVRRALAENLERRTLLAAGTLDPSFGTGGIAYPSFTVPGWSRAEAVAFAGGGKVVIAGAAGLSATDPDRVAAVARLNPNGTLDGSFSRDGWATFHPVYGSAHAVTVQPDAKVVVAGVADDGLMWVARVNADGSPDGTFNRAEGIYELPSSMRSYVGAVAVQSDGKILATGGADRFGIVRIMPGGFVDTTYGFGGVNAVDPSPGPDHAEALVVNGDGSVVVAGTADWPNSGRRGVVARFNAFGRADTSFGGGDGIAEVPLSFSTAYAVHVLADGKVMVAGTTPAGFYFARLNADGTPDTTFAPGGFVLTTDAPVPSLPASAFESATFGADGRVVAAGPGPSSATNSDSVVARRYNANGTIDTSFGTTGEMRTPVGDAIPVAADVAVAADGSVAVAARAHYGTVRREEAAVVRLTSAGQAAVSAVPYHLPLATHVGELAETLDGKLVGVGSFEDKLLVARFHRDGSPDTSFDSDGWRLVDLPGGAATFVDLQVLPDGKLLAGGWRVPGDIVLVRLNPDATPDTTFGQNGVSTTRIATAKAMDLALQTDGRILVTAAAQQNQGPRTYPSVATARFNTDGSLDTSFAGDGVAETDILSGQSPEGAETPRAIAVLADGRIVVGAGIFWNTQTRTSWAFICYLPDGTIDPNFGNPFIGTGITRISPSPDPALLEDIRALPDGGFLASGVGRFLGTEQDMVVGKFLSDGTWDPAFGQNGFAYPGFRQFGQANGNWVDLQADGKIIVGGPLDQSAEDDYAVARLNPNGTLDTTFGQGGRAIVPRPADAILTDMVLMSDGGIVFGGSPLVRLTGDPAVPTTVTGRNVFYNDSAFDGNNPAANIADLSAVAQDKAALRPGGTGDFVNVTSYTKGINGVIVELAAIPPAELMTGDFTFRTGTTGQPSAWAAAPSPASVTALPGPSGANTVRYAITWANGAIRNTWLQVTVNANARTGLAAPDVFYYGNLVADTGLTPMRVDTVDYTRARAFASPAPVGRSHRYDFDRDGRITSRDVLAARMNLGRTLTKLAAPAAPAGTAASAAGVFTLLTRARRSTYDLLGPD